MTYILAGMTIGVVIAIIGESIALFGKEVPRWGDE